MAGRPRKATAVLERSGAFAHDPQRRRRDPATTGPIGDPPPSMPEEMHAIWYELAHAAPTGILRNRDRLVLELAVRTLHHMRTVPKFRPGVVSALLRCLIAMGMTPADASRVAGNPESAPNPFAKFKSRVTAAGKPN